MDGGAEAVSIARRPQWGKVTVFRNPISTVAIVVILLGGLILAGPSFGFSSLAADRGLGITTADDPNANLGIESEGDVTGTELKGNSDPLQVGTLYNNVDEDLEVRDVVVDSIGDSTVSDDTVTVAAPSPGDVIATNDTTPVTIECAADVNVGVQEVVVRVDRVSSSTISIADPTFSVLVDIQCGKGKFTGSTGLTVSDVSSDSTTQTVSFNVEALKNRDTATVNFTDPQENGGVDYWGVTDADVTITSGQSGTVSFDPDTARLTYTADKNVKGTIEIDISNVDVVGSAGDTYQVTYSDTTGRDDGDFFEITD